MHYFVSLFTREWIEIVGCVAFVNPFKSPSLRGSGLKFKSIADKVDSEPSPSLRGSGLKYPDAGSDQKGISSLPLYEGVD